MNKWLYQYLKDESLHYLTEVHPDDGILGEYFFHPHQFDELKRFILENNLSVKIPEAKPEITEVKDSVELFMGKYHMTSINFDCLIKMYGGGKKVFKSQHSLSLEAIEQLSAEELGIILKRMLKQLKKHIKNEEK